MRKDGNQTAPRLTISENRRHFLREGRPFFWLADTVWSAFTSAIEAEWIFYLDRRASQGFNVLQIDILPQWDRSFPDLDIPPFALDAAGQWDLSRPSPAYFDRAERMLQAASDRGFVPALVPLWVNYVDHTWASRQVGRPGLPPEALESYLEMVLRRFARFAPVYLCSGDSAFESEAEIALYQRLMARVKQADPEALTTLHPGGGYLEPPKALLDDPNLDFYMYQSSHGLDQTPAWRLAKFYGGLPIRRPLLNGEPCYEGHGYGNAYGRFSAYEVRRASWQSVMAGATAGITYGAHGLWGWHGEDSVFGNEVYSSVPFCWQDALGFTGAGDMALLRDLAERYALYDAAPLSLPEGVPEGVFALGHPGEERIFLYTPCATRLKLPALSKAHQAKAWLLADRRVVHLPVKREGDDLCVALPRGNSDALIVLEPDRA